MNGEWWAEKQVELFEAQGMALRAIAAVTSPGRPTGYCFVLFFLTSRLLPLTSISFGTPGASDQFLLGIDECVVRHIFV